MDKLTNHPGMGIPGLRSHLKGYSKSIKHANQNKDRPTIGLMDAEEYSFPVFFWRMRIQVNNLPS